MIKHFLDLQLEKPLLMQVIQTVSFITGIRVVVSTIQPTQNWSMKMLNPEKNHNHGMIQEIMVCAELNIGYSISLICFVLDFLYACNVMSSKDKTFTTTMDNYIVLQPMPTLR